MNIHSDKVDSGIRRTLAIPSTYPVSELEQGKRTPFHWPVFSVESKSSAKAAVLQWATPPSEHEPAWLRLTIALELWEDVELEVSLAHSQRIIGRLNVHFCDVFETVELELSTRDAVEAETEGVSLHLTKGIGPLWLFGGTDITTIPDVFAPHLLRTDTDADPYMNFLSQVNSLASIQQFGWKEGCVLDGLLALDARWPERDFKSMIEQHLNMFLDKDQRLRYEDPWGRISDNRIYGIEGTLPFAVMALIWPKHPSLTQMTDYYEAIMQEDGAMYDEGMFSTEGNYTTAYPIVAFAKSQENGKQWEDNAIQQLRLRKNSLTDGEHLYLRRYESGERTFRNWIRAYTWYLLGLIKTLQLLKHRDDITDLREEFIRVANIILAHQQPCGLWRVFVDDPSVEVETSGSAGIATALTLGVRMGLLPNSVLSRTRLTLNTLIKYLTPDGMLGGVSQANKNGELLQRSKYRIRSQMGMGLMAQLVAILDPQ